MDIPAVYLRTVYCWYFQSIWYWVTQKLPQIYTVNHATFPIQIRKITVQICGNFWVTQYYNYHGWNILPHDLTELLKKIEKERKRERKR